MRMFERFVRIDFTCLWAMISAPLLLGSDLTQWPQSLFDIACNHEAIAIDKDRLGRPA